MERSFLEAIKVNDVNLPKEVVDFIMNEADKDISALNTQLTDLQSRYDTDTANLQQNIADQALGYNTEKFFGQFKFTSELAKKAAVEEFKAQKFEFDEKTSEFTGGKEWIEKLKKENPAAFEAEESAGGQMPFFTGSTSSGDTGGQNGGNTFNFGFAGLRPMPEK